MIKGLEEGGEKRLNCGCIIHKLGNGIDEYVVHPCEKHSGKPCYCRVENGSNAYVFKEDCPRHGFKRKN